MQILEKSSRFPIIDSRKWLNAVCTSMGEYILAWFYYILRVFMMYLMSELRTYGVG